MPMLSKNVFELTPYAMPKAPSIIWAIKPTKTYRRIVVSIFEIPFKKNFEERFSISVLFPLGYKVYGLSILLR